MKVKNLSVNKDNEPSNSNKKANGFKNLRFSQAKSQAQVQSKNQAKVENKAKSQRELFDIHQGDEYFDDINGMDAAERALKKFPHKHTNFFSKVYEKITPTDIVPAAGDMLSGGLKEKTAFAHLNAISNFYGGTDKLKANGALKSALKVITNDDTKERWDRVTAGKLLTRITGVPVTMQRTQRRDGKPHWNLDTYIVVPRIQRIFRPDRYVENYKAGNWLY